MQSKHFIFVGVVTLGMALGAAETDSITTRHGVTYTNAVIQRADPDGVVIEYAPQPGSVGMAKLKFANLPDELQKRYNYNATEAVAFEQNQVAGIARREEAIARAETEKQRRHDELAQQRADREAAMEAKRQEAAAMAAAQSQMDGWYGGDGYYGNSGWYGTGRKRVRYSSNRPDTRLDAKDFSSGVGLSGLGTGWGNAGHWGPLPSQAPSKPSQSGAARGGPWLRGNPSNFPDKR